MKNIRPGGSGQSSTCGTFLRPSLSPSAGLVFSVDDDVDPSDWPTASGPRLIESQLGHAAGWGCEVRANDIILLDPLGEGVLKADRPELSDAWIHQVRSTSSAAVFLVPEINITDVVGQWAMSAISGSDLTLKAATVRTSISSDAFAPPKVGRNDPCFCGSGKKFKTCHGKK